MLKTCEHNWRLDSTLTFVEGSGFEFAILPPAGKKYKDMEFCIKCGDVKRFIWEDNPNWKEDNPYWKEDYGPDAEIEEPKT